MTIAHCFSSWASDDTAGLRLRWVRYEIHAALNPRVTLGLTESLHYGAQRNWGLWGNSRCLSPKFRSTQWKSQHTQEIFKLSCLNKILKHAGTTHIFNLVCSPTLSLPRRDSWICKTRSHSWRNCNAVTLTALLPCVMDSMWSHSLFETNFQVGHISMLSIRNLRLGNWSQVQG